MNTRALRRTAGSVTTAALVVLLLALAIPAVASEVTVAGDCEGWTVHIDGTWGAYLVTVDGVTVYGSPGGPGSSGQGDPIDWQVPDTTDATTRTFVVTWHNHTTGTHTMSVTGTRVLDCDPPDTTTTVPDDTTTTVPDDTTTTVPEETTTTVPEVSDTTVTTTTLPEETPTTQPEEPETTTTTAPPEVQAETTTTVAGGETDETLPFTGVESDQLALMALLAVAAGGGLVFTTRRSEETTGSDIGR